MPTQTYLDQVQNAYIAYYGRPADPGGQGYWAGQLELVSGSLTALVNQFGNSDEFNAFAAGKNKSELINQLYLNLFNRSADKAGLDWYVGEVEAGRKTIATIALDVLNGATGVDTATLASKFQAANAFSAALDTPTEVGSYNANSLDSVKNWLKGITTPTESAQAVTNINSNLSTILLMQTPTESPAAAKGSQAQVSVNAAGTDDASAQAKTYTLTAGTYTYTIDKFGTDDVVKLFPNAALQIISESVADSKKMVVINDANSNVVTLVLTNLTPTQEEGLFLESSFDTVFGSGTMIKVTNYTNSSLDGKGSAAGQTTETLATGAWNLTDAVTVANNVKLTGFGADDKITITGATSAQYDNAISSNSAGDVTFAYNNAGTLNQIVLVGVAGTSPVYDVASFNALSVGDITFA